MSKKILVAAIICATIPLGTAWGQTVVYTDDFAAAYNYTPGVVTGGAAPSGTNGPGIWSGVYNTGIWNPVAPDQNIPFNSNTDTAGELKIGPGIGAAQSLGWGDQQSDAPFLFVRIPANQAIAENTGAAFDFQATVKLTSQTFGNWSTAGIIARTADVTNNPSGSRFGGILDENFTTAMSFNALGTIAHKRIENGLQVSDPTPAWALGPGLPGPAALPVYIRLTRTVDFLLQVSYEMSMSSDNVTFVSQGTQVPTAGTALADRTRPLDIGLSWHPFNGAAAAAAAGQATYDDFRLEYAGTAQRDVVALPPPIGPCDAAGAGCRWNVNGNGDLDLTQNWVVDSNGDFTSTAPNSNTSRWIFGALQTTPEDVLVTNATRTLKELNITNTTTQMGFIGAGTLNFDSDSGPALININSSPVAGHQIQLKVTLQDDMTATATGAATLLSINAPVYLNGHTLTVAGTGTIRFNNGQIAAGTGAGGSVVNEGDLAGLAGVDGDLSQSAAGTLGVTVGGSPINVTGSAVLDGVLDVSLADGFHPVNGQTYTVLTADSVTNAGLALGGDAGAMFRLSVGASSVSLTAVPEPSTIALMGLGALALGVFRRRRKSEVSSNRDFNNMRRVFTFSAALAAVALTTSVSKAVLPGPAPTGAVVATLTDDFSVANDYKAGVFPGGTIWTGIWNKDNGGATAVASSNAGLLTMEDLREHNNSAGLTFGAGWEGPNNGGGSNAPYLYTTIDSPVGRTYDLDIYAKVSDQWNGNWSKSAIVARVAGVAPGKDPGTGAFPATENFISAGTFLPQDNFQVQRVLNGTDAGVQTGNAADRTNVAADAFWNDPIWIGISKRQDPVNGAGLYRYYTSLDDVATPDLVTTWVDSGVTTPMLPMFGNGADVEVGLSHHEFFLAGAAGGGIPVGQIPHSIYDYFSVTSYDTPFVPPALVATWNVNNANLNNITTGGNWVTGAIGAAPGNPAGGGNTHQAVFGAIITQPRTVIVNAVRTYKQLTFDNANTYAIAGIFRITMEAATGTATINVEQGSHIISAPMTLNSTTNLQANGIGSRLDINNELNMGAQIVNVSGPGRVSINSTIDVGPNTAVVNNTGNLGGSGRINGSLNSTAGSINPGSSTGTLTVDSGYTQTSTTLNIELGGTLANTFDVLAVTGTATLTSGIVDVTTVGGFSPTSGNTWNIVTATVGLTSGLTMAAADASAGYSISVVGNNLQLLFNPVTCTTVCGDYNNDTIVNAADYTVYRNRKSGIGGTTLPNDASPGSITFADYTTWKANYGLHNPGSGTGGSVPEPTSIALLLIAALGAFGFVRQR